MLEAAALPTEPPPLPIEQFFCSEILADFPAINNILGAGGFECRPLHKDQFSWYILFVMEIINGIAEIWTPRQLGEKLKRYLCATQSRHQSTNLKGRQVRTDQKVERLETSRK